MVGEKRVDENQDLLFEKDPNDKNLIEVSLKESDKDGSENIKIRVANKELLMALREILVKEEDLKNHISKFYLEPIDYDVLKLRYIKEKLLSVLFAMHKEK